MAVVTTTLTLLMIQTTWCLLFLSIQSTSTAGGRCAPHERDALLAFRASLTDPGKYLSSWRGKDDCCQWNGVHCSNRTSRHVVKLQIGGSWEANSGIGFQGGQMNSSLRGLQHLRSLDLRYNNFNGMPVPEFIGGLTNLRYLYLSDSKFGGRVPPQLGNLSSLLVLVLGNVSDTFDDGWASDIYSDGLPWLSRLTKLQYLDLSYVNLSTVVDWAHVVNKLPSLVTLSMLGCRLQIDIPSPVHINLTSLEYLDLGYNNFRSPAGAKSLFFWDLPSLLHLDVADCGLQGLIPEKMGNMTSIIRIDLYENDLTGIIPTTFGNLHNLEDLWLRHNNLNGALPELLQRLAENRLSTLDLDDNNLTGSLPDQLGHFTKLTGLDLSHNRLSGGIPSSIGALTKLTYLDLSYNKLSGGIPSSIGALTKLTGLDLSHNRLSGGIPSSIGALTKLTELQLGFNNFDGTITETHLGKLANLYSLELSENSLTVLIQERWVPSFKLTEAALRSCRLGPTFPQWLKSQDSIDTLDISNASISDSLPQWFWITFARTQNLVLSRNQISGMLSPTMFQEMEAESIAFSDNCLVGPIPKLPRKLTALDLSKNNLSGPLPTDFGAPFLDTLFLFKNSLSGGIPHYLCELTYLVSVDLSENQLHGSFPNCKEQKETGNSLRTNSSKISMLKLNTNNLSGEFPTFLSKCQELIFLDLSYNQFSGILPTWIGDKLPSLAFLSLRSNLFSSHIPQQLGKMKELQYLDFSSNNMSGTIPETLGDLAAMAISPQDDDSLEDIFGSYISIDDTDVVSYTESSLVTIKGQQLEFEKGIMYLVNLDLSCNTFTGNIPEAIGKLAALKNLNLSWNHMSGVIPDNVGKLHSLESLDLSQNQLSGEIPASLSALTSLAHLNLSYNRLTGKIPSGNQLQTLNDPASIYIGNPGLCGPPLTNSCSKADPTPATPLESREVSDTVSFFLAMCCGYVVGLWTVFCLCLFKKDWIVVTFSFSDHLYDWIYVQVALSWAYLRRKRE